MYCPRLDHNVRLNYNGTVSLCGHMTRPPSFESYGAMIRSDWLASVRETLNKDQWPSECKRCEQTESLTGTSLRTYSLDFAKQQTREDFLVVAGVLDNVCNSACLTCNEQLSTKIGSLKSRTYLIVNNVQQFWNLPIDRVVHLDINGGEPSASKNYQYLLENLPPNVTSVRINTNCSRVITEVKSLLDRGIKVTVTVSLDGLEAVHDIVRWPIKWTKFYSNLLEYQQMSGIDLNTWTTVSALNLGDFNNILNFVKTHNLNHSYALLSQPSVLDISYSNSYTVPYKDLFPGRVAVGPDNQSDLDRFLLDQYNLRNIS